MHYSLRFDALNRLPPHLRGMATSAAAGSLEQLQRIYSLMSHSSNTGTRRELFLPVFYANLDNTGIPVDPIPEPADEGALSRTARAWLSISALNLLQRKIPRGAYIDMWPRIWPWVQYIDVHPHLLPGSPTEDEVCTALFGVIREGVECAETAKLMDLTPGVRAFVPRAWAIFLRRRPLISSDLNSLCHFIGRGLRPRPLPAMHREEYIEGGNGCTNLAALALEHLATVIGTRDVPLNIRTLDVTLFSVSIFLDDMYDGPSGPFVEALLAQGFARSLVSTVLMLNQNSHLLGGEIADVVAKMCFKLLVQISLAPRAKRRITEACGAGLIRAIVGFGTWAPGTMDPDQVETSNAPRDLLRSALPGMMTYLPVVSHIALALASPEVQQMIGSELFMNGYLFDDWNWFAQLARERIEVFRSFESVTESRACDNTQCYATHKRTDFKRCAGCQSA
ncbi:hypothetical protein DFH06DRAFT_1169919, partial [Mycena polygramma]